jgi:hypothetical protein
LHRSREVNPAFKEEQKDRKQEVDEGTEVAERNVLSAGADLRVNSSALPKLPFHPILNY